MLVCLTVKCKLGFKMWQFHLLFVQSTFRSTETVHVLLHYPCIQVVDCNIVRPLYWRDENKMLHLNTHWINQIRWINESSQMQTGLACLLWKAISRLPLSWNCMHRVSFGSGVFTTQNSLSPLQLTSECMLRYQEKWETNQCCLLCGCQHSCIPCNIPQLNDAEGLL